MNREIDTMGMGLRVILALVFAIGLYGPAAADGVPKPDIAKATGEACVEPTDIMRRNHMDYLKHQRDDTMYGGIRKTKYSLRGCIDCHASADSQFADNRATLSGFCYQCHKYAAVQIDCFGCHNPVKPKDGADSDQTSSFDHLARDLRQELGR